MVSTLIACAVSWTQMSQTVTFVYDAAPSIKKVTVAGSFNNWNKEANPLTRSNGSNSWAVKLSLPVGKHHYKFVLDNDNWITDPKAAKNEDDGNGNVNSVLFLSPPDYSQLSKPGDLLITRSALGHDTAIPDLNFDRGRLQMTLRVRAGDVGAANVVIDGKSTAMKAVPRDEFTSIFKAEVPWDGRKSLRYLFALEPKLGKHFLGKAGLSNSQSTPQFEVSSKSFRPFQVPNWVEGTVFYQIFPDRFRNGSTSNDPAGTVSWETQPQNGDHVFGGDAVGVHEKVGYLKSLGVNGIYFNPVFESPVIHRYETTDYRRIDSRFGTNAEFKSLVKSLKSIGIRVVLDGVFNHVAPNHPAFADVLKNQERSTFKDWFYIKSYPVAVVDPPPYEAWWGYKSMPKVNLLNASASKAMLEIPGFWEQEAQIDGWRLDVANEVPMEFWRKFRSAVKGIDSEKWIVGEVWGDGSQWLKGDQWDSVMNYPFRDAVLKFVAEGTTTPTQFADRLTAVYELYPPQVSRNMMNLIGSHDTPRFRTQAGGSEKLAKMGATVLLTWIGAPSIYYGDELGMLGGPDPDNRRGMAWNTANSSNSVLTHYKTLIATRQKSRALQVGDFHFLVRNDSKRILAYERVWKGERVIVALNRSDSEQSVDLPIGSSKDVLGAARVSRINARTSRVTIPALSSSVFR